MANTKNGLFSLNVCPAAVTERSCMASSNADWVLGGVRLISSAKIIFAKRGPFMNLNWRFSSNISGFSYNVLGLSYNMLGFCLVVGGSMTPVRARAWARAQVD